MRIIYPYDILIIGVMSSWSLGFLISVFAAISTQNANALLWYFIIAVVLIYWRKRELDKFEDQRKLAWVEPSFLTVNLITILVAFVCFVISFSPYWFPKEIRYFSLAFGLPSLFAVIYWRLHKNHKEDF